MADGETLVNAVIGAVVTTLVGGVVPLGPLFGGAAAGYLQGGDRSDGTRVGLISGLIALVPTLLFGFFVLTLFGLFALGAGSGSGVLGFGALGLVAILFVVGFGAVYVVGLSAAGGWIGNYVRYDTEFDL